MNPTRAPEISFSHIGLFVNDLDRIVDFWTRVMRFFVTDRGELNGQAIAFLSRDPAEHHQLVFIGGRDVPIDGKLLNQMSFRVETLADLLDFIRRLESEDGVSNFEPVIHGNAWSLYFRDVEHNRVEVFTDSDWYINQPIKEVLDFTLTEEEIRRQTLEFCRSQPGFKPIAEWRAETEQMMGLRKSSTP